VTAGKSEKSVTAVTQRCKVELNHTFTVLLIDFRNSSTFGKSPICFIIFVCICDSVCLFWMNFSIIQTSLFDVIFGAVYWLIFFNFFLCFKKYSCVPVILFIAICVGFIHTLFKNYPHHYV